MSQTKLKSLHLPQTKLARKVSPLSKVLAFPSCLTWNFCVEFFPLFSKTSDFSCKVHRSSNSMEDASQVAATLLYFPHYEKTIKSSALYCCTSASDSGKLLIIRMLVLYNFSMIINKIACHHRCHFWVFAGPHSLWKGVHHMKMIHFRAPSTSFSSTQL